MPFYYGAKSREHVNQSIKKACDIFGPGFNAMRLLAGTCCAETHYCQFPDKNPEKLGVGATQFDLIRLVDIKQHIKKHDAEKLRDFYSVIIEEIQLKDLAYNVELAFALTRIGYKRIPEPIPTTLVGQADYWKDHWNSHHPNAAGTPEKYIEEFNRYAPDKFKY